MKHALQVKIHFQESKMEAQDIFFKELALVLKNRFLIDLRKKNTDESLNFSPSEKIFCSKLKNKCQYRSGHNKME